MGTREQWVRQFKHDYRAASRRNPSRGEWVDLEKRALKFAQQGQCPGQVARFIAGGQKKRKNPPATWHQRKLHQYQRELASTAPHDVGFATGRVSAAREARGYYERGGVDRNPGVLRNAEGGFSYPRGAAKYRLWTLNASDRNPVTCMTGWMTKPELKRIIIGRWGHWPPFAVISSAQDTESFRRIYDSGYAHNPLMMVVENPGYGYHVRKAREAQNVLAGEGLDTYDRGHAAGQRFAHEMSMEDQKGLGVEPWERNPIGKHEQRNIRQLATGAVGIGLLKGLAGAAGAKAFSAMTTNPNDEERRQWVDNDEGLYDWYRSSRLPMREFIKLNRKGIDEVIARVTGGQKPAHYMKYGSGGVRYNPRRYVRGEPLPPISGTEMHTWFERDRAHVELRDKRTGETIIEWWDEAVNEAVEDGFLTPRDWHGSAYQYAQDLGMGVPRNPGFTYRGY